MSTVVVQDRIIAFAVDIKGMENGHVKGDIYELGYRDHITERFRQLCAERGILLHSLRGWRK